MEPIGTIDAHQHFWKYDPVEYSWIDEQSAAIKRDFLPADLRAEMITANVSASVAVQARQTLAETKWLLDLAAKDDFIVGVVGWAPIASQSFPQILDDLTAQPKLKGLRHVVQGEPDGFLVGADFNAGIAATRPTGLVFDILIFERQLPQAIEFIDRHPQQIFILDHVAKPRIAEGALDPWATNIAELARRENIYCKLSGMVTEANWKTWTPASLKPYVDVVLEAFGPRRLMVGSDWPVCTLASNYANWFKTLDGLLASLTLEERQQIYSRTAVEAYRLKGN